MNLAWREVKFSPTRFIIIVAGMALILTAALAMKGLHRGLVHEALVINDNINGDLWVVQGGRVGPFVESSYVDPSITRRAEGIRGVKMARRFIITAKTIVQGGRAFRAILVGIDFPTDLGGWIPLVAGRYFHSARYEAIADVATGLVLGEQIRLGRDEYEVVGITSGHVQGGDPVVFLTIRDAMTVNQDVPSEAILLRRAAQRAVQAAPDQPTISAALLTLENGADIKDVAQTIARWGDVRAVDKAEEAKWIVDLGMGRIHVQILAFVIFMFAVSAAIISLTVYTMVTEKVQVIALLKLMGAKDSLIVGVIIKQALMIGLLSLGLAVVLGKAIFPLFPRMVIITATDVAGFVAAVIVLCLFSSVLGIRRALQVKAQEILS